MRKHEITQEIAKAFLHYNPETGLMHWIVNGQKAGKVDREGYVSVRFFRHYFAAHRLIWLLVYGKYPDQEIDHINGEKADNRLSNLRDVSRFDNAQNTRRLTNSGLIGLRGVVRIGGKKPFAAQITAYGKSYRLGRFDSAQQAHEAYIAAKRQMHGGCTI